MQKGDGKIIEKIRQFIIRTLDSRPKVMNDFLKKNGHKNVVKIRVCREPVTRIIQQVLNILTLGKWSDVKKKYNYDDIYHLFSEITLDDDSVWRMEKNQRVNVKRGRVKKGECIEIRKPVNIPVIQFITNGERTGKNFYRYDAVKYNCQNWQRRLLNSNGINEANNFISQNTQELLSPRLGKVAQAVTDVAGVADIIQKGGGKEKKVCRF
jgi:hypothetical protein